MLASNGKWKTDEISELKTKLEEVTEENLNLRSENTSLQNTCTTLKTRLDQAIQEGTRLQQENERISQEMGRQVAAWKKWAEDKVAASGVERAVLQRTLKIAEMRIKVLQRVYNNPPDNLQAAGVFWSAMQLRLDVVLTSAWETDRSLLLKGGVDGVARK
ncbi:hypothetical protein HDV00_006511 [Rhizophlyctis rosea]|nr:hypothetical protein HDV00_006511 [Rhizophlyctis rosea]